MKKLFLLFTIFISCDGRKSQHQALNESVEKFKKNKSFTYNIFKPETLLKKTIDSTLSNGYRVKIKIDTDITNFVAIINKNNSIQQTTNYRNYKFNITVEKKGKLIFNDSFDKIKTNKLLNFKKDLSQNMPLYNFDKLSVLQYIALRDDAFFENQILIDLIYAIPETDRYIEKTISITDDGSINTII